MQGKRGFTLIEVLIVVIILGILATIAIPQFGKVVERARFAEVATNAHAIKAALAIYYMQEGALTDVLADIESATGVTTGVLSAEWTGPVISGIDGQNFVLTYTRAKGDSIDDEAIYTSSTNVWSGGYDFIP